MMRSHNRIGKALTWLAFALGLAVATLVPAGYFLVTYSQVDQELALLAELKATRLAKYLYVHRDLWQYHAIRLSELTEILEAGEAGHRQRIRDAQGNLVLETGVALARPIALVTAPVVVGGSTVATIETATTIRPILARTGGVAVLSSLLGLAIFFAMRMLPIRIINQTVGELTAAEERYRLLFDSTPFPTMVVHRDSLAFLAVNTSAVDAYGWSREEFLKMRLGDLRPLEDVSLQLLTDATKNPGGAAVGLLSQRHRKKEGTIIDVDILSHAIVFDGEPAAIWLATDVTNRNTAERARQATEQQLRQSQKMEAVGQLTGGIAHDFNNILAIIMANIEALAEDENLRTGAKIRVEKIGTAVNRAADLTRQLLSFSRKQPLRPQVTDLNDLVDATTKLLRRSLGSHIEITTTLRAGLGDVNIDRSQLEAALINLCINARDAMPDGGKLLIETRSAPLDEDYPGQNPGGVPGDYSMIAVTDTGTGMPRDLLAKVFDPFFTTKEAGKGTGLGLSMVYGFIKQSKGHIKIDSEVGRGTTFKLYLPKTSQAPERPVVQERPAMPRGTERILLVEDDAGVRANTAEQLKALGYDVDQAEDGAAGLAVFETAARPYDLLLTDVVMPKMDGKALADEVAARWPRTKIVFMSGYAERAIVHHGIVDAGVRLLSKPFRRAELAKTLRETLDAAPVRNDQAYAFQK